MGRCSWQGRHHMRYARPDKCSLRSGTGCLPHTAISWSQSLSSRCVRTPRSSRCSREYQCRGTRGVGCRWGRLVDPLDTRHTCHPHTASRPGTTVSTSLCRLLPSCPHTLLSQDPQLLGSVARSMQYEELLQWDLPGGHTHLPFVQDTLSEGHYSE